MVGGVGAAKVGDLGRVMLLEATIFAISAEPEEVSPEALENRRLVVETGK